MKLKEKLLAKLDKREPMNPLEKGAKLKVVKELQKQAGSMLGEKVGPKPDMSPAKAEHEGMEAESGEEAEEVLEEKEPEECSPEELDEKIAELEALKQKKLAEQA